MNLNKVKKIIFKWYEDFINDPIDGISISPIDDDIFNWNLIIFGPKDSYYEGCIFNAKIQFPENFPIGPPVIKFTSQIYHPNIYTNGIICISILHPPGNDIYGYESSVERWRPVHTINSILLSIISLFFDPNDESPANVEAAKLWREDKKLYQKEVNKNIRKSLLK